MAYKWGPEGRKPFCKLFPGNIELDQGNRFYISLNCPWYPQTGPRVLHNLTFHIKSGERIGIGDVCYVPGPSICLTPIQWEGQEAARFAI